MILKFFTDAINNGYARLLSEQSEQEIIMLSEMLPSNVSEGDWLTCEIKEDSLNKNKLTLTFEKDCNITQHYKNEIDNILKELTTR